VSTALCLALAFGSVVQPLPSPTLTLSWTHSVEHTPWQEDYVLEGRLLHLREARVKRSGAGMDPPAGAVWTDGWWHYDPGLRVVEVALANSTFGAGYTLCFPGSGCRHMDEYVPRGEPVRLTAAPCTTATPSP